jgi:hypothetical protein
LAPILITPREKPLLRGLNHLVVRATTGVQVDDMPIPTIAKKRTAVIRLLALLIKKTPRVRIAQKQVITILPPRRSVKFPTMGANTV